MPTAAPGSSAHAGAPRSSRLRRRHPQLLVLALATAAMLASGPGQSFLIAVFVDDLIAASGSSRTGFSLLYAGGTVVSAASMPLVGRLADRAGLRTVWIVAAAGLAGACVLASFTGGLATAFFALAFLRTFGQGTFPLAGTLLVATSFAGRRGQAMAVSRLGLTGASILLPPVAVALVLAFGWRDAYRLLGLVVLVLVLPLAFAIRESRVEDRGHGGARPGSGAAAGRHPRAMRSARRLPRVEVPTRRTRRLLFVVAAPAFLTTGVVFHSVALLADRGLPFERAGAVLALLGIAAAAATIGSGMIADRTSTRVLLTSMSSVLLAALLLVLLPTTPAFVAGYALVGAAIGLSGVVGGIVFPRTYGLGGLGRLQGTAWSAQITGAAIGPLPLALSEALTGGFEAGLGVLALYAGTALLVSLRWRDPRIVRRG